MHAALDLHDRASAHLRAGQWSRALAVLSRMVLALPPDHPALPGLWTTLAFVYQQLGRNDDSVRAATNAMRLSGLSGPSTSYSTARRLRVSALRRTLGESADS